jgi:hypothetical protein
MYHFELAMSEDSWRVLPMPIGFMVSGATTDGEEYLPFTTFPGGVLRFLFKKWEASPPLVGCSENAKTHWIKDVDQEGWNQIWRASN